MLARGHANPYTMWLFQRRAWPSITQTLGLAAGLWCVSATGLLALLYGKPIVEPATALAWWAAAPGGAVATLVAAMLWSVAATLSELRNERRLLLRLAGLSGEGLVRSYVLRALYRIRVILLVALGLSPALVVGWAQSQNTLDLAHACSLSPNLCQPANFLLVPAQLTALLGMATIVTLTLLNSTIACCSAGVWMALRWQSSGLAIGATALLVLGGLVPLIFVFGMYSWTTLRVILDDQNGLTITLMLLVMALMGAFPHLMITENAWGQARRWAWHHLLENLDSPGRAGQIRD